MGAKTSGKTAVADSLRLCWKVILDAPNTLLHVAAKPYVEQALGRRGVLRGGRYIPDPEMLSILSTTVNTLNNDPIRHSTATNLFSTRC
jgi:hypothetical protein